MGFQILDIPELSGKVIGLTGGTLAANRPQGTAGLGYLTLENLAEHNPQRLVFTGRNQKAVDELIHKLQANDPNVEVSFVSSDFTSVSSVNDTGRSIAASNSHIDILFCNAGAMAISKATTKDGYENQFGINHLAHAALIRQLLPVLLRSAEQPGADICIVANTSLGAFLAGDIRFQTVKSEQDMGALGSFRRYGQSKLANILYAQQLAKRYPSIMVVTVHPGVINTGLISGLSTFNRHFVNITSMGKKITIEEGAKNQLWAATTKKENLKNGGFYEPVGQVGRTSAATRNEKLGDQLWDWTETTLTELS